MSTLLDRTREFAAWCDGEGLNTGNDNVRLARFAVAVAEALPVVRNALESEDCAHAVGVVDGLRAMLEAE